MSRPTPFIVMLIFFFITSYFTLQQVKVSIEIVFGSQLTRKDDNVIPHIDSRVKIIDNERPGAGPCDLLLVIVRVPVL
jgi:hypothetical protein